MEKRFKLKVEDVLNKQFNIDFKGYSSVEVDEFRRKALLQMAMWIF